MRSVTFRALCEAPAMPRHRAEPAHKNWVRAHCAAIPTGCSTIGLSKCRQRRHIYLHNARHPWKARPLRPTKRTVAELCSRRIRWETLLGAYLEAPLADTFFWAAGRKSEFVGTKQKRGTELVQAVNGRCRKAVRDDTIDISTTRQDSTRLTGGNYFSLKVVTGEAGSDVFH